MSLPYGKWNPFSLSVRDVDWKEPFLRLSGRGWHLLIDSPWRIVSGSRLLASPAVTTDNDRLRLLVGDRVVGVHLDPPLGRDPRFLLRSDLEIHVFSLDAYESWVFKTPETIYTGPNPGEHPQRS